jgi:hypothetical protein
MTQPLYLDYPGLTAAYAHPEEYLYGSNVLVAPVTSPGSVADATVWIPPGRWVDYFTGATFNGPVTTTVSMPLSRMPVFVRSGGIIPEQASSTRSSPIAARDMILKVFSGSGGSFDLYADAGTGLGYTKGQYTDTPMTVTEEPVGGGSGATTARVTVGAARGHYPGEPASVSYQLDLVDLTEPSQVALNGRPLAPEAPGSAASGWYYQGATATVVINAPAQPTDRTFSVTESGGRPVDLSEPPTPSP